ncbi:glycosyltransferase family 4 protein [Thomasclavelia ramosa]|uniref:glycosyltransferase family 4 protein n=1 Tax=Thomasclavelia ramosa TaxID=1547 RepID=UPI0032BFC64F
MNILMMVSWYSPKDAKSMQAGVFHYEQSINLKSKCNVALYFPYDNTQKENFSYSNENGLLTFRTKRTKNRIWSDIRIILDFIKIRKQFSPDVIHAHVATVVGKYACIIGKLFGIPVVVTEHTPTQLVNYDKKILRMIGHYVYKNSKFNACVSLFSKNELELMFPDCQFNVVYNGVFQPQISASHELYAKKDFYNLAIVATFYSEWIKGYQFLLPAIKIVKDQGYNVMLHIVGGGDYQNKYENLAKELDIWNNCIFYGNCNKDKVYDIIGQMDFGLSTSLIECSGVSVQEALMLGKPMVVTKSGGADSLVTNDNAIIVEKGSEIAIANGIIKMIDNLKSYNSDQIKKYAIEKFEISQISDKYYTIYKEITNQNEKL